MIPYSAMFIGFVVVNYSMVSAFFGKTDEHVVKLFIIGFVIMIDSLILGKIAESDGREQ
jgi:hypothetical protein